MATFADKGKVESPERITPNYIDRKWYEMNKNMVRIDQSGFRNGIGTCTKKTSGYETTGNHSENRT